MESPQRVEIVVPTRTLVVAAGLVLVILALVSVLEAILLVAVGIFGAFVFEFPIRSLMQRTGWGRGRSATLVVLGTALALTTLAVLFLVPIVGGIRDFVQDLPELVANLRASDELGSVGGTGAGSTVQDGADAAARSIPDTVSAILGVAGNIFSVGLAAFTLLFVTLFVAIDMPRLKGAALSLLMPEKRDATDRVWESVTTTVSRWAIGAATIAVIAGTVQGTTAWILGSSYALALGVIAGLLDLIPNLGATIAGVILVPAIYAEEGLTKALIMLVVVLVYQQVENNVLSPTIYGKAVQISGFLVIGGVTIFGALLGVLGALVAVPVTASLQIIAQEATRERRRRAADALAARETAVATAVE